jgi:hypothetical protein
MARQQRPKSVQPNKMKRNVQNNPLFSGLFAYFFGSLLFFPFCIPRRGEQNAWTWQPKKFHSNIQHHSRQTVQKNFLFLTMWKTSDGNMFNSFPADHLYSSPLRTNVVSRYVKYSLSVQSIHMGPHTKHIHAWFYV